MRPNPMEPFDRLRAEAEARGITTKPHGWVQWKGTDVCMDIHCACGAIGHVDADFAYFVECQRCERTWAVSGHVMLLEVTLDECGIDPRPAEVDDED